MSMGDWKRVDPKVPNSGGPARIPEKETIARENPSANGGKDPKATEQARHFARQALAADAKPIVRTATPLPVEGNDVPLTQTAQPAPKPNAPQTIATHSSPAPTAPKGTAKPAATPSSGHSLPPSATPPHVQQRAVSHFTSDVIRPPLTELLTKAPSKEAVPPKTKPNGDLRQEGEFPKKEATNPNPLPITTKEAPVVPGRVAVKEPAAATTEEPEKTEEGESVEERSSEDSKTSRSSHSGNGQKLEAASSGVAGGGDEGPSYEDQKPGLKIFNAARPEELASQEVHLRYELYIKYVLKAPAEVAQVLEKALAVEEDPELNKVLSEGLAGRLNVYGGTSA